MHQDWYHMSKLDFRTGNSAYGAIVLRFRKAHYVPTWSGGPAFRHGKGDIYSLKSTRVYVDGYAQSVLPDPERFNPEHFDIP